MSEQVIKFEEHDEAWVKWFSQERIQPVKIIYESRSANPQSALATVLSALGLDPSTVGTVAPRTAKLADSESHELVTRFRMERRNQDI